MNQDILLSKIVPNPTDTTWSQAYTTLNVYITLSIEKSESKSPVISYGKEILEKLQREFFAVDQKTLDNIKQAISKVAESIDETYKYSIIVGAIVEDILYIVIASEGQVAIKRGEKVGVVANGVTNEIHGFSGRLKHDDIIIFQTSDFGKKIPLSNLSDQLLSSDVIQIAENITPIIHENSKGTESAIILQYKNMHPKEEDDIFEKVEKENLSETIDTDDSNKVDVHENLWTKPMKDHSISDDYKEFDSTKNDHPQNIITNILKNISLPKINLLNKKIMILSLIILLSIILVGGIFYQIKKSEETKKEAEFSKIYTPINVKFEEANQLLTLNKSLALDAFTKTLSLVDDAISKYGSSTSQFKKLSDLKSQIKNKISEIGGGGSAKNVKEFVKVDNKIKSITNITAKGGSLIVLDNQGKQVVSLKNDGSINKAYDLESTTNKYISADEKYIYVAGNTVTSIDRGNSNTKEIMKKFDGSAFDIFGSNLYTLNGNDIFKYKAPAYEGASYFADKPNFKSTPIDMSIAGPIYVLESNGSVESFTKGKKDDFEITGLSGPIGEGAKIYSDQDFNSVYVLDIKNQRVVVLDKKGEFTTQYEGSFIKDSSSFAIDEENKIGYVLKSNTVFSFDL